MSPDRPLIEVVDRHCLTGPETQHLMAPVPWRQIAVLGDGLGGAGLYPACRGTAGYRRRTWPRRLQDALRAASAERFVRSFAQPGQTTLGIRYAQFADVRRWRPDLLILCMGTTETVHDRSGSYSPAAIASTTAELLHDLAGPTAVLLIPPSPGPGAPPRVARRLERLAPLLRQTALETRTLVCDLSVHPAALDTPPIADAYLGLTGRGHAVTAAALAHTLTTHHAEQLRSVQRIPSPHR